MFVCYRLLSVSGWGFRGGWWGSPPVVPSHIQSQVATQSDPSHLLLHIRTGMGPKLYLHFIWNWYVATKWRDMSELLGFWTLSIARILNNTREYSVLETGSVSIIR
jgi:hypothetical protein